MSEKMPEKKASSNGEADLLESQKTPSKHQDGKENKNLNKTAEKSATGKNLQRQQNGSAEPKVSFGRTSSVIGYHSNPP